MNSNLFLSTIHGGRNAYPLRQLSVHHEVVDMLFRSGQLKFTRYYGHYQRCTAGTLRFERKCWF